VLLDLYEVARVVEDVEHDYGEADRRVVAGAALDFQELDLREEGKGDNEGSTEDKVF